MFHRLIQAALALVLVTSSANADTSRTIIVMDGSGSMWGQIDGRTKLEIARETVTAVLGTIPADQELGLMAYGHRERGNCNDIELMVPPAAGTAAEIAARVNTMRFQGRTPLSEAVRQAAEVLRYGEEAATVVLVTDGLETCEADPCALGRELEAAGLNFTAHVIGFGLTEEEGAQVACLAEETGGQYLQASDAGALADALTRTVTAPAVARAPDPVPTPDEPTPTALLSAPATAPQGSRIPVSWAGPRSTYDYVRVFDANGDWRAEATVGEDNPLELQLPWLTGEFTLAYVLETDVISETIPITLTPAPVSISAPATAQVGQEVTITWVGPDAFLDNIQLLNADTGERWGYGYTQGQDSMVWTMPDVPGAYGFAYSFRDSEVIHTTPITVILERAEISPAPTLTPKPDAAPSFASTDVGPVDIAVSGPYMGTLRQWAAVRLPDGETVRSTGERGAPWEVALTPGQWLITAIASGADSEGLAAVVDITAAGPIEVGQPTFATTPVTDVPPFHRACLGAAPCVYHDEVSGLRMLLMPGWLMQDPEPLTTAAGEGSGQPWSLFGTTGTGSAPLVALNPRQWDAMLGPCEDTAAGPLCHMADIPDTALSGFRVIAATVRVTGTAAAPPQVPAIEGTPLNLDPETATTLRNRLLGHP